MTREGLDVFEEFGITDTRPVPVYTNGPAAIEMGTTSPIVGVSNNYLAFPRFSLAIKNRPGWQGRITGLKELVLLLPEGVNITNPGIKVDEDGNEIQTKENDCNVRFKPYGITDCEDSCETFVEDECKDVCRGYDDLSEKRSCKAYCSDEREDCVKQCGFLFNERDQEYKGYALAQSSIDTLQKRIYDDEDSERFERFNCKLNPIRDEVLGNTPITTKFFRVKARYNYTVESPITVQIVKAPDIEDIEEEKVSDGEGSPGGTVVTLYEHIERGGDSISLGVGRVDRLEKLEDEVSSIDVKPGYVISYFEKRDLDYSGGCRSDVNYVPNLKEVGVKVQPGLFKDIWVPIRDKTFNDDISSVKVSKFEGAVLYEDEEFEGRSDYYASDANNFDNKCVDDDRNLIELGNDEYTNKVTSIKVAPGFMAILYNDPNFNDLEFPETQTDCNDKDVRCIFGTIKGEVIEINNLDELEDSNGKGFNDKPSSIRIVSLKIVEII